MPKVLIFEPHAHGHRAIFVRYLLESMARHGGFQATWLVNRTDLRHPQIADPARQFSSMVRVVAMELPTTRKTLLGVLHPLLEKQFRYFRVIKRFIEAAGEGAVDYVFIPFIDDYGLTPLSLYRRPFAGLPWGGIILSPRYYLGITGQKPRRLVDLIESALYGLLFRTGGDMHEVFTIDPFFQQFCAEPRLHYIPDPATIDCHPLIGGLEGIEIADGDFVILVYGNLDHRKAIPQLLRAMTDPRIPQHTKLLLVGVQHEYVRSLLDQPFPRQLRSQGRLIEVDKVVSDAEETAAFHSATIVWTFYPGNYGPSGVFVRAGQAAKPVVCTKEGYCGRVVREVGMGIAVDERDSAGLVDALLYLIENPRARAAMGEAGCAYFSKSSPTAFADPIVAAIARRCAPA